MVRICIYMWLVGASIGHLSSAYINAEIKERIRGVTVRSLKFLTTYQVNVSVHPAGSIDELLKEEFLGEWKGNFFTPEEMSKIYNSVEGDWRYYLNLASSNEDNLTALVVALLTKMEAYMQSLYYMPPRFMLALYPERYDTEHCHNLAAKFLILSYIGTDQLIKKLLSIAGSSLSDDNLSDINEYQTLIAAYYNDYRYSLRNKQNRVPDKKELSGSSFGEYFRYIGDDPLLAVIQRLSSKIMFGYLSATVKEVGYIPHSYLEDYLNFIWEKAKDVNKRLTELSKSNDNYNVISALFDIIIQRAEFAELSPRDFENELKGMILKNLEIRLIEGEFSVNLT